MAYMDLAPHTPLQDIAIDRAFIGSCTNARLTDLRDPARILKGRKVAPGVRAMISPGSSGVRRAAEAEGIDRIRAEEHTSELESLMRISYAVFSSKNKTLMRSAFAVSS